MKKNAIPTNALLLTTNNITNVNTNTTTVTVTIVKAQTRQLQHTLSVFKKGAWANGVGAEGEKTPVFVVGMMRSGSTLVEQILASHPKVMVLKKEHPSISS